MKVTLKEAVETPLMSVPKGTHDIDDALAAELIEAGLAEKAKPAKK